jgi:hypothetical protein
VVMTEAKTPNYCCFIAVFITVTLTTRLEPGHFYPSL